MANYATDAMLLAKRPNLYSLDPSISDWTFKHDEATEQINHDIEIEWFRPTIRSLYPDVSTEIYAFDADRLLTPEQLKVLGIYKALELIYEYLAKDLDDDPFKKERDHYERKYKEEFKRVMASGIDYDFDGDDAIETGEEKISPLPRTLERI